MTSSAPTLRDLAIADDYDPNSMPVDKAREHIRSFLTPIGTVERLHIRDALGRVLASDVASTVNVPSHDNSGMDGYAVRHADLAADRDVTLEIAGASFAGKPFQGALKPGQAVRIMTGATVPPECDTVIMQERAQAADGRVTLGAGARKGQNVRLAGEDLGIGQVVFRRGQLVRAAELGMLASLGIIEVDVYRRLRVAFFSTGDELVPLGGSLGPGQIYDSNRYTLFGMLQRLGCEVLDMGVIRDTPEAVEAAFASAAQAADVVITSGGVSVGEADYVKQILDRLGDVLFWKIAMKPGRPLAFGKIGTAHFFGLPGNPVAVMVTFYQFVRDALQIIAGRTALESVPTFKARLTAPTKKAPGRTEFQRGILSRGPDGEWTVRPTGNQGSGILSSMSQANCFMVLPTEQGNAEAGALVDVQPFEGIV
ncbi:MAG: molybdopterin molybdenumtransferase MoeA [Betaproteobacteria bacterium]|nr:molybdopterin molybdenumtransferase MoeA [Betaproteobacteria bacterium]